MVHPETLVHLPVKVVNNMAEIYATNEPTILTSELAEEMAALTSETEETTEMTSETSAGDVDQSALTTETASSESAAITYEIEFPEDLLTNEFYQAGIDSVLDAVDAAVNPDTVHEEVYYVDRGSFYSLAGDLPDYAVVYQCNGIDVVFPTEYAEQIYISDGMLVNLGSNYTAGLQLEGYEVSNYLSSELTIPTYHSSTWYQYLQSYGQPYRIVDRYVNNYGSISSSTRSDVYVEWSGGNPWQGFTFERIALFFILLILVVMFVFRKGR